MFRIAPNCQTLRQQQSSYDTRNPGIICEKKLKVQLARVVIRRQHANAFFVVDADGATAVTADGQQVVVYLCTSVRASECICALAAASEWVM